MSIPKNLKYTKEHEWVKIEGNQAKVGITDYAQEALGDVVFAELPQVGGTVSQGDSFGTVESVKAVSDIYAPVSGKVVEINNQLEDSPELVNQDPYGKGWMVVIDMSDPSQQDMLLDAGEYQKFLEEQED